MYQIFINDKCLTLCENRTEISNSRHLIVFYDNDAIISTIETLEQDPFYKSAEIIHADVEQMWDDFKKQIKIIEAAGGLVINKEHKILMIFRQGKWDLPKGKIEKNEKKKEAAVREVEEECGISRLEIIEPLNITYHCYFLKNERVLKITYWYLMKSDDTKTLTPQLEEDITEVRWVDMNETKQLLENSFPSIRLLMMPLLDDQLKK